MNVDHLQVENGNFTRIVNPLIEELIKLPFKGCELAIALHIIRKTYGFQKKEDEISISQFEEAIQRGRPTVVKALKNLQLVNVVKLVKVGNISGRSSVWTINKYTDTWKLVKMGYLVKGKRKPSEAGYTKPSEAGLTHKKNKEITKETATSVAEPLNKTLRDGEPMDLSAYVASMRSSPRRYINFLGEYADEIKFNFSTRGQWRIFTDRNVKAARQIELFTDDQIGEAMGKIKANMRSSKNPKGFITEWSIETLLKYLTK